MQTYQGIFINNAVISGALFDWQYYEAMVLILG